MDYAVREVVALPNGSKALLYDMPIEGAHVANNLACLAPDGSQLWTASPGEVGPDEFIGLRFDGVMIVANTWSGFAVWIDAASGNEVSRSFTK